MIKALSSFQLISLANLISLEFMVTGFMFHLIGQIYY